MSVCIFVSLYLCLFVYVSVLFCLFVFVTSYDNTTRTSAASNQRPSCGFDNLRERSGLAAAAAALLLDQFVRCVSPDARPPRYDLHYGSFNYTPTMAEPKVMDSIGNNSKLFLWPPVGSPFT